MKKDLEWEFRIQLDLLRRSGHLPEATIADIENALNRVAGIVAEYNEQVKRETNSGDATPQGIIKREKFWAGEAVKKLDFLKTSLSNLDQNIKQTEAELQPKAAPAGDPILQYLREQEIRSDFRGKDPLQMEIEYHQAQSRGDLLVASAIENSPRPLIRPEVIAQVREERSRREHPEVIAKLDFLQSVRHHYNQALMGAQQALAIEGDDFNGEITTL
jgi:hypothetical protein